MQDSDSLPRLVPPHLPFKTVKNFITGLGQPLPGRIDRSLMRTLSGGAQSSLVAALRYLDLITVQGTPTEKLVRLAASEGATRQKEWQNILRSSYSVLFEDGIDLSTATPHQFQEQIRKAGVSGDTVRKSAAFFIAVAKEAELPLSRYLTERSGTRSTGSGTRQKRARVPTKPRSRGGAEATEEAGQADEARVRSSLTWEQMLLAKFPAFDPGWPDEVKTKWFDAFDRLMNSRPPRDDRDQEGGQEA